MLGILKDLLLNCAACSRFFFGRLPAPVLHFALVKAHGGMVPADTRELTRSFGEPSKGQLNYWALIF